MDFTRLRSSPQVLSYASPPRRSGRPVLAAVIAILSAGMGLLGVWTLFYGIVGIVFLFKENRAAFPADLFEPCMFLIIGACSAAIALCWCRAACALLKGP